MGTNLLIWIDIFPVATTILLVRALALYARGCYEEAVVTLKDLLEQILASSSSLVVVEAIVYYVSNCYVLLADWASLEAWVEWLRALRARESQYQQVRLITDYRFALLCR